MAKLEAGSIGAVVTDPPFFTNIGRPDEPTAGLGHDPWNSASSVAAATAWATPIMAQCRRCVRRGGAVVVMAGVHGVAAWMTAAEDAGLAWMAEMVVLWNSGKPRARNFGSLHTHILWFAVPGARHTWNSERRSIYSNILVCTKIPTAQRHHPAQKPVELTTFLISLLTKSEDVVLDPFCGSGSTLVSAEILGRTWMGVDMRREYVEMSRRRTDQYEVEEDHPIYLWINGRLEAA